MNEASETEEGRVRGGRQLSEEERVNALFLLGWTANRTHLPYGVIANIARELLCSPGLSKKFLCDYLMTKSHSILSNPKMGIVIAKYFDPDDFVKEILSSN